MSSKLPPRNDPDQQITETIDKIQESEAIHDLGHGMTPLGKRVLADTEKLLETTKRVLDEKNTNDEIQNIVYYGTQGARDISGTKIIPEDFKQKVQAETSTVQQDVSPTVQDAFKKILKIPNLIMSNSEFRLLINEINSIVQEAISLNIPKQDDFTPSDNNNKKIQKTSHTQQSKDPKEATEETAKDVAQQLREGTYPIAKNAAEISGEHIRDYSEGKKSLKEAVTDGASSLKTAVQESVTNYQLSKEQRDRLVTRFKNVMIEAHKNPEFQDAISELLDMISRVSQHTQEVTKQISETVTETTSVTIVDNSAIQIATKNAKDLIENFANNRSLDPLISSLRELGTKVKTDQEMRNYFKDLQQFVVKSLHDTNFVQNNDYIDHGSRLIQGGRKILLEKYNDITNRIQKEASTFNKAIQKDKTLSEWTNDFDNLINFAKIIPVFANKIQYVPLPRIENSDEEYDYAFDNFVLHLPEILPRHLHISLTSDVNLDNEDDNILKNYASFEISKLCADARNIAFFYKKKKGLINMIDVGLVDFSIPDNGLKFYMKLFLDLPTEDRPYLQLNVLEAETQIESLKLRLHDTKHDFLYTILTPLVQNRIRKQLENLITEKIKSAVQYLQENLKRLQSQTSKFQQNINIKDKIVTATSAITGDTGIRQPDPNKSKAKEVWQSQAFDPDTNTYAMEE
nr:86_t:CDS:2 [Entrophospora candida]